MTKPDLIFLRKTASDLNANRADFIKIAGVVERFRNWMRALYDKDFASKQKEIAEFYSNKNSEIKELVSAINKLDRALKSGNPQNTTKSIGEAFETFQRNMPALEELFKKVMSAGDRVPTTYIAENGVRFSHYDVVRTTEGTYLKDEETVRKLLGQLPNIDVPISNKIGKELREYQWFKRYTPSTVDIQENARDYIRRQVLVDLNKQSKGDSVIRAMAYILNDESFDVFIENLKTAIVSPVCYLDSYMMKLGDDKEDRGDKKKRKAEIANEMEMIVQPPPVKIPKTEVFIKFSGVYLKDLGASVNPRLKLKYIKTESIDLDLSNSKIERVTEEQIADLSPEKQDILQEVRDLLGVREEPIREIGAPDKPVREEPAQIDPPPSESTTEEQRADEDTDSESSEAFNQYQQMQDNMSRLFGLLGSEPATPAVVEKAPPALVPTVSSEGASSEETAAKDASEESPAIDDSDEFSFDASFFEDEPESEPSKAAATLRSLNEIIKTAGQVDKLRTEFRGIALANALRQGYQKAFGKDPTAEILSVGYAQAMQEQGGRFWNNNFGNITATKDWMDAGNDWMYLTDSHYDSTGKLLSKKPIPFRSYPDPSIGAADYWKFLTRYKNVLDWFATGDALSAGLSMGYQKYYSGPMTIYSGNMQKIAESFMNNIAPKMSGLVSNPQPDPEEKPVLRKFRDGPPIEPQSEKSTDDGEEQGLRELAESFLSAHADSHLVKAVKKAVLRQKLPESRFVIEIDGPEGYDHRAASILTTAAREFLQAKTAIHEGPEVELVVLGSQEAAESAVKSVAGHIQSSLDKPFDFRVRSGISNSPILSDDKMEKAIKKIFIKELL